MNSRSLAAAGLACATIVLPARAAQLQGVAIFRAAIAEQTSASPAPPAAYSFIAGAVFDGELFNITGELRTPRENHQLFRDGLDSLALVGTFPTLAAMDDTFRAGNYRFVFSNGYSGNHLVRLTLTPLPAPPVITNFDALQMHVWTAPLTIRWQSIPGATANDTISLSIDDGAGFQVDSPDLPGTATEYTVTFSQIGNYTGTLIYTRAPQLLDAGNGVEGAIGTLSATAFPIVVLLPEPVFNAHPLDFRVPPSGEAFFRVRLGGDILPEIKWQRKPAGSPTWSDLTDGGSYDLSHRATLHLTDIHPTWYGDQFRCVATATGRSVSSNVATLLEAPEYDLTDEAGQRNESGFNDGTGSAARFFLPEGIALDLAGNLYIAERNVLRKMTPGGVVTTLAGSRGFSGVVDGAGSAASFAGLVDVAVGPDGNLYGLDEYTIRRITPAGVVTTLAGVAGLSGTTDGTGADARFEAASFIAADGRGNLFVADVRNFTIRKITLTGEVTTIAGSPGQGGYVDGVGAQARFQAIQGLAADAAGNVYVTDNVASVIRKVAPGGIVTTVSVIGGTHAWLYSLGDIAVDARGHLLVEDGNILQRITPDGRVTVVTIGRSGSFAGGPGYREFTSLAPDPRGQVYFCESFTKQIRKLAPVGAIVIDQSPAGAAVTVDQPVVLTAAASGGSGGTLNYQWRRNGVELPGATGPTFSLPSAQAFDSGEYTVMVTGGELFAVSATATVQIAPLPTAAAARPLNLSTRARVETGDRVLIPGFVIQGSDSKRLLIRAVGPTLGSFGVSDVLADPRMFLKQSVNGTQVDRAQNDDWNTNANAAAIATTTGELGAFPLPAGSRDAALLLDVEPGTYTVLTEGVGGGAGVAIVELYDADAGSPGSRLINISNRGFVGQGENIMIPGFVVSPEGPRTFLIRAVGPGLSGFGIAGVVADPRLDIFRQIPGNAPSWILGNDNWGDNALAATTAEVSAQVSAFPLAQGSNDAAFVVTLSPGNYTVQASGIGGGTGVALVEVYLVP